MDESSDLPFFLSAYFRRKWLTETYKKTGKKREIFSAKNVTSQQSKKVTMNDI